MCLTFFLKKCVLFFLISSYEEVEDNFVKKCRKILSFIYNHLVYYYANILFIYVLIVIRISRIVLVDKNG